MASPLSRGRFLAGTGLGLAAAAVLEGGTFLEPAMAAEAAGEPASAKAALASLLAGNARFVAGTTKCASMPARRAELIHGQAPFAAILSCSDSRVPVETVFDHEPGDIFAIRIAGNFVSDAGLGSMEYAVAALKSKLVMVLGHSNCGAVKAAVENVKTGATVPGHMMIFVDAIVPAAKATQGAVGDWTANAVAENVRLSVKALSARSTIVADALNAGQIEIVGAIYDLHTGAVTLLET